VTLSPALADRTIVRLRASLVTNAYGDEERNWEGTIDRLEISGCAVHPAGTDSTTEAARSSTTTRQILFAPPGADLEHDDRVEVDGLVYQFDGDLQSWESPSGTLDHVTATLQRIEG
jgi:hypothetical protein